MKLKVTICNKALWSDYYKFLSVISVITSLIFLFYDIPKAYKNICAVMLFALFLLVFLGQWARANLLRKVTLMINDSEIDIEEGDIFSGEGYRIIAFNEFFDTQVDDVIISERSINGQYIKKFYPTVRELDDKITRDTHAAECIAEKVVDRKYGKQNRYALGTIIKDGDYFLLAFSRFDCHNRAVLEIDSYVKCLMNMWNECDIHYSGQSITLPLLGSGITRFEGHYNITDQELLKIIVWTFKMSKIRLQRHSKVKIVLTKESMDGMNLFEIKNHFTA